MDAGQKQNNNKDDTRTVLLEAASRVIRNQGMGKLTLQSVALEAGVSKGGLLYHFPSREALVAGLLARGFDEFDQAISDRVSAGLHWLDAYVEAALAPGEMDDLGPGLLAAVTENPALLEPAREKYRRWFQQASETGGVNGVLVLLILDGIFMHQTLGLTENVPLPDLVGGIKSLLDRSKEQKPC